MRFAIRLRVLSFVAASAALLLAGPALAGSIKGTVKFEGEAPTLRPIKMDADPGCAKKHSSAPKSEMLVLGSGNTLGNVLVQVRSGLPSKTWPVPSQPLTLDQDGCRYIPHVAAVMAGQPIKILNSDGLLHNIHALPNVNQSFNQAMPASVTEITKSFSKSEPVFKIKCDVHPWMSAYLAVLDHPFFAVTQPDGKFEIKNLPAGSYELEAWHEKLPAKTAKVTVAADGTQTVDFAFSVPKR